MLCYSTTIHEQPDPCILRRASALLLPVITAEVETRAAAAAVAQVEAGAEHSPPTVRSARPEGE